MIHIQDMCFSYGEKPYIENFDLDIQEGEILSIIGPNGSGKSTVLKNISKKLSYQKGAILLGDEDLKDLSMKALAKKVASLSQHNESPVDFTVKQLVEYGRLPHKKWYEPLNTEDQDFIQWAMCKTGVDRLSDQSVHSLSGGERQRVWIAMTLAQDTKILLLDEPTTYLDICHQLEVLELITELNRELGMTVVMVLHDLNQACQYSHRVCVMQKGKMVKLGKPSEVFTSKLIQEVYNVEALVEQRTSEQVYIMPIKVFKGGHSCARKSK